jgi:hypothetical protein
MDQYTLTLAREYVELVEMMTTGNYTDHHSLDSARQVAHNDLCRILDVGKNVDMYVLCRNMIHDARAIGDYDYDFGSD